MDSQHAAVGKRRGQRRCQQDMVGIFHVELGIYGPGLYLDPGQHELVQQSNMAAVVDELSHHPRQHRVPYHASVHDLGILPPCPGPLGYLRGVEVLARSSPSLFHFAVSIRRHLVALRPLGHYERTRCYVLYRPGCKFGIRCPPGLFATISDLLDSSKRSPSSTYLPGSRY
jgi:hypothetical protein